MEAIYDQIGLDYSVQRCTDSRIAKQLNESLKGATRIINIGAGTGSYEPTDVPLVAVEPSAEMIAQRKPGSHPVKQATAEQLPFANNSFSHAMTILSMHHWQNKVQAFNEINRVVTQKFVTITWDPEAKPFWLTRDYFPEIHEMDIQIFPTIEELKKHFDQVIAKPLFVPHDCRDGFFAAFWRRPEAYLSEKVRKSMSPFAKVNNLTAGLQKLKADLEDGSWQKKNKSILNSASLDVGYKIVTAKVSSL